MCFLMQMVYVCGLCASCGSPQCCVMIDLQFVNARQGYKRRPYGGPLAANDTAYNDPGMSLNCAPTWFIMS